MIWRLNYTHYFLQFVVHWAVTSHELSAAADVDEKDKKKNYRSALCSLAPPSSPGSRVVLEEMENYPLLNPMATGVMIEASIMTAHPSSAAG